MAPKGTWAKAIVGGVAMCVGGPALVMYVMPTEEQLIDRYNPELKARALANRDKRQQDFDDFVMQLRENSKSNRHIWDVAKDNAQAARLQQEANRREQEAAAVARKEEIRQQALSGK